MSKTNTFFCLFFLMITLSANAQNLMDYQWKNRLLVILLEDLNSENYTLQIDELQSNVAAIKERKLLIILVNPKAYKVGLGKNSSWQKSDKLYKTYHRRDTPFETLLIGLDGGIKARKKGVFKSEDVFAIIDAMPMRRAEIKN